MGIFCRYIMNYNLIVSLKEFFGKFESSDDKKEYAKLPSWQGVNRK